MPRRKQDPLIAALIAKLPKQGEEWPVDLQNNWLLAMAMMFGIVYGGDVAERLKRAPLTLDTSGGNRAPQSAMPKPPHRFIIDAQGYARNAHGKRIMPKDCDNRPIFDMRGQDGDMRTIVWADDSTGLNGADLVITA